VKASGAGADKIVMAQGCTTLTCATYRLASDISGFRDIPFAQDCKAPIQLMRLRSSI